MRSASSSSVAMRQIGKRRRADCRATRRPASAQRGGAARGCVSGAHRADRAHAAGWRARGADVAAVQDQPVVRVRRGTPAGTRCEQPQSRPRSACCPSASPVRLATRKTCVSTAIVGSPKATLSTTLAVLRPTPGSASQRLARRAAPRRRAARPGCGRSACRFFALVRYRPIVRMRSSQRRQRRASSIFCGVGASANRRARRLVDADVGGLRRQQHRGQQLEHAACTRSSLAGCGLAARRVAKKGSMSAASSRRRCRVRSRARASAASTTARLRSSAAGSRSAARLQVGQLVGCALRQRSSCSRCSRVERAAGAARSGRAPASACAALQASQPVRSPLASTSAMQSTGQTGTHSSQPVHSVVDRRCASASARRRCSRPGRP